MLVRPLPLPVKVKTSLSECAKFLNTTNVWQAVKIRYAPAPFSDADINTALPHSNRTVQLAFMDEEMMLPHSGNEEVQDKAKSLPLAIRCDLFRK